MEEEEVDKILSPEQVEALYLNHFRIIRAIAAFAIHVTLGHEDKYEESSTKVFRLLCNACDILKIDVKRHNYPFTSDVHENRQQYVEQFLEGYMKTQSPNIEPHSWLMMHKEMMKLKPKTKDDY